MEETGMFFLTGASGSIGYALYGALTDLGHVTGCARSRPAWWREKDDFIEADLLNEDISTCFHAIKKNTTVIHLLNLAHKSVQIDIKNTENLYEHATEMKSARFIYVSSIRVYSSMFGSVSECDAPIPEKSDSYGNAKLNVENLLLEKMKSSSVPVTICRIGSVFSVKTERKIPIRLTKLSRITDKGMSTHLISANNVADAIKFILTGQQNFDQLVYNITQEIDNDNDYLKLGDVLSSRSKSGDRYSTSRVFNILRNVLKRLNGQGISMPYVKVEERALKKAGYSYPINLKESLKMCRDEINNLAK